MSARPATATLALLMSRSVSAQASVAAVELGKDFPEADGEATFDSTQVCEDQGAWDQEDLDDLPLTE